MGHPQPTMTKTGSQTSFVNTYLKIIGSLWCMKHCYQTRQPLDFSLGNSIVTCHMNNVMILSLKNFSSPEECVFWKGCCFQIY